MKQLYDTYDINQNYVFDYSILEPTRRIDTHNDWTYDFYPDECRGRLDNVHDDHLKHIITSQLGLYPMLTLDLGIIESITGVLSDLTFKEFIVEPFPYNDTDTPEGYSLGDVDDLKILLGPFAIVQDSFTISRVYSHFSMRDFTFEGNGALIFKDLLLENVDFQGFNFINNDVRFSNVSLKDVDLHHSLWTQSKFQANFGVTSAEYVRGNLILRNDADPFIVISPEAYLIEIRENIYVIHSSKMDIENVDLTNFAFDIFTSYTIRGRALFPPATLPNGFVEREGFIYNDESVVSSHTRDPHKTPLSNPIMLSSHSHLTNDEAFYHRQNNLPCYDVWKHIRTTEPATFNSTTNQIVMITIQKHSSAWQCGTINDWTYTQGTLLLVGTPVWTRVSTTWTPISTSNRFEYVDVSDIQLKSSTVIIDATVRDATQIGWPLFVANTEFTGTQAQQLVGSCDNIINSGACFENGTHAILVHNEGTVDAFIGVDASNADLSILSSIEDVDMRGGTYSNTVFTGLKADGAIFGDADINDIVFTMVDKPIVASSCPDLSNTIWSCIDNTIVGPYASVDISFANRSTALLTNHMDLRLAQFNGMISRPRVLHCQTLQLPPSYACITSKTGKALIIGPDITIESSESLEFEFVDSLSHISLRNVQTDAPLTFETTRGWFSDMRNANLTSWTFKNGYMTPVVMASGAHMPTFENVLNLHYLKVVTSCPSSSSVICKDGTFIHDGATFSSVSFYEDDFSDYDMNDMIFIQTTWQDTTFNRTICRSCTWNQNTFDDVHMQDSFFDVDVTDTNFTDVTIQNTHIQGTMSNVRFVRVTLRNVYMIATSSNVVFVDLNALGDVSNPVASVIRTAATYESGSIDGYEIHGATFDHNVSIQHSTVKNARLTVAQMDTNSIESSNIEYTDDVVTVTNFIDNRFTSGGCVDWNMRVNGFLRASKDHIYPCDMNRWQGSVKLNIYDAGRHYNDVDVASMRDDDMDPLCNGAINKHICVRSEASGRFIMIHVHRNDMSAIKDNQRVLLITDTESLIGSAPYGEETRVKLEEISALESMQYLEPLYHDLLYNVQLTVPLGGSIALRLSGAQPMQVGEFQSVGGRKTTFDVDYLHPITTSNGYSFIASEPDKLTYASAITFSDDLFMKQAYFNAGDDITFADATLNNVRFEINELTMAVTWSNVIWNNVNVSAYTPSANVDHSSVKIINGVSGQMPTCDGFETYAGDYECQDGILLGPHTDLTNVDCSNLLLESIPPGLKGRCGCARGVTECPRKTCPNVINMPIAPYANDQAPFITSCINGYIIHPLMMYDEADISGFDLTGVDASGSDWSLFKLDNVRGRLESCPAYLPRHYFCMNQYIIGPGVSVQDADFFGLDMGGLSRDTFENVYGGMYACPAVLPDDIYCGKKLLQPGFHFGFKRPDSDDVDTESYVTGLMSKQLTGPTCPDGTTLEVGAQKQILGNYTCVNINNVHNTIGFGLNIEGLSFAGASLLRTDLRNVFGALYSFADCPAQLPPGWTCAGENTDGGTFELYGPNTHIEKLYLYKLNPLDPVWNLAGTTVDEVVGTFNGNACPDADRLPVGYTCRNGALYGKNAQLTGLHDTNQDIENMNLIFAGTKYHLIRRDNCQEAHSFYADTCKELITLQDDTNYVVGIAQRAQVDRDLINYVDDTITSNTYQPYN